MRIPAMHLDASRAFAQDFQPPVIHEVSPACYKCHTHGIAAMVGGKQCLCSNSRRAAGTTGNTRVAILKPGLGTMHWLERLQCSLFFFFFFFGPVFPDGPKWASVTQLQCAGGSGFKPTQG